MNIFVYFLLWPTFPNVYISDPFFLSFTFLFFWIVQERPLHWSESMAHTCYFISAFSLPCILTGLKYLSPPPPLVRTSAHSYLHTHKKRPFLFLIGNLCNFHFQFNSVTNGWIVATLFHISSQAANDPTLLSFRLNKACWWLKRWLRYQHSASWIVPIQWGREAFLQPLLLWSFPCDFSFPNQLCRDSVACSEIQFAIHLLGMAPLKNKREIPCAADPFNR